MSVGKFAFLPNLRSGAAADGTRDGVRLRLSYDLEITGNGAAQAGRVAVAAQLKGPGDVVGLDAGQIVRVEPEDVNKGFEPNYFPFIELRDPDLPWRYTLDSGTANRLTPWLVLIALKRDEFTYLDQGSALAPRIEVANIRTALPDLAQAWAWAHVQVDMDGAGGTPHEALAADPGRGFARLMACRKLDEATDYTLFLVPSYKVGVQAALGEAIDAGLGTAPAWEEGVDQPLILPYYYRHSFKTEAGQDLELLLRKLRAVKADEEDEAGASLWVDAGDVGYYTGAPSKGYRFPAQAALTQPDTDVPPLDTPKKLQNAITRTLNAVLAEQEEEDGEDPLVTFPAHGRHYTGVDSLSQGRAAQGHWFERINLDLKFRAAAGLGRKIVRENDEHFAQLCWDQYDEILAANRALQQLQVATLLAGRLEQLHFSRLPSEVGVQLGEPLLAFTRIEPDDRAPSAKQMLTRKRVPDGFAGLSLRRVAARKPQRLQSGKDGPRRRVPIAALPGDDSPSPESQPPKDSALRRRSERLAKGEAAGGLTAALRALFNPELVNRKPKPRLPQPLVGEYSSARVQKLLGDKLVALPRQKADFTIKGRSAAEVKAGGIVWRAPRVPEPLVDYLCRVSRDGLLSNVQALPDNTVSFYEENRLFVEALMVGANHAMAEELRWREYPTDMRGTVFHRFWNRGAAPDDRGEDDIQDIRLWGGKLGKQVNPADTDGKQNLVVVIKGEVVRKLRDPLVEISIASGEAWAPDTAESHPPVFFGKIGRDAVYYGFDISREYVLSPSVRGRAFFAIYEPPARLRFGLDVGNTLVRRDRPLTPDLVRALPAPGLTSWDDLSWKHMRLGASEYVDFTKVIAKPPQDSGHYWNATKHAAGLARSFWQKPLAALLPLGRVL